MIKKAEIAHRIYVDEEVKQKFVDVALKDYFNPQKAFCEVVAQGVVLPTIKQVNEEDVGYFQCLRLILLRQMRWMLCQKKWFMAEFW